MPHPQIKRRERAALTDMVIASGLPRSKIEPWWWALLRPCDAFITTDVATVLPLRCPLRVLLIHGVDVGERELQHHPVRPSVNDFDWVVVGGHHDHDKVTTALQRLGRTGRSTVVSALGIPAFDRVEPGLAAPDGYRRRLGLEPGRPVVLIAPHWRDLPANQDGARRLEMLVDALRRLPVELLLKPHQMALHPRANAGFDWGAVYGGFEGRGVAVDWQPADDPAMAVSSVLVTGSSSRSNLFMLLNRPVVRLPAEWLGVDPGGTWSAAMEREGLEGSVQARDLADLVALVAEALADPGALEVERAKRAARLFSNQGVAAAAVTADLLRRLDRVTSAATGHRARDGATGANDDE